MFTRQHPSGRCRAAVGLRAAARPRLPCSARASAAVEQDQASEVKACRAIDDKLSWRPLQLDPAGYYIIRLDRARREILADHYSNAINDKGLAVDEATGEVIGCRPGGTPRLPRRTFRGRTAKELSVRILEQGGEEGGGSSGGAAREQRQGQQQAKGEQAGEEVGKEAGAQQAAAEEHVGGGGGVAALPWISRLEHANYLGREFVRAEMALLTGAEYVQD